MGGAVKISFTGENKYIYTRIEIINTIAMILLWRVFFSH